MGQPPKRFIVFGKRVERRKGQLGNIGILRQEVTGPRGSRPRVNTRNAVRMTVSDFLTLKKKPKKITIVDDVGRATSISSSRLTKEPEKFKKYKVVIDDKRNQEK